MNHYERLKVNPDAPIEVIRAAYRALAAKHHPDRHTQSGASHGDMVALNAAYEVLADPVARAAYDAELAESSVATEAAESDPSRLQNFWRTTMGFGQGESTQPAQAHDSHDESRVEVNWQAPPSTLQNPWLTKKRLIPLAGVLGAAAVVVGAWWIRSAMQQMEAEQTLSQHYGGKLHAGGTDAVRSSGTLRAPQPPAGVRDEDLLAEPPLPGQGPIVATHGNHLLDGSPLSLRQETHLVDPLALPTAASAPSQP